MHVHAVTLLQGILCVCYVDENKIRLVKSSQKRSLQDKKPISVQPREVKLLESVILDVFLIKYSVSVDPKLELTVKPSGASA